MVLAHLEPELEKFEVDDIGDDGDDGFLHHYLPNFKQIIIRYTYIVNFQQIYSLSVTISNISASTDKVLLIHEVNSHCLGLLN